MENIFLKIFNMSITASWIALAVMLLRLPLKKAPKWIMGVLWAFVALRLILPISFESILSLIPSAQTLPADFTYSPAPEINSGIPMINSTLNPVISRSLAPEPDASANPTQIISFVASVIWIIGMVGMLLYMLISFATLKLKVRENIKLDKTVRVCDRIPSPFVLGVIFPRIYLPSGLGEEDMRYVMEHEKAHIRRGDHLWKPLGFLLLSVYWFNPILWAAYIFMCRDIELACDERVIAKLGEHSKRDYSEALINCSAPRRLVTACPLAFGEIGVKERIKRVLNYKKPAFWIIILAIVSCAVVAVCFLTNPKKQVTIASVYEDLGVADVFADYTDVWLKKGDYDYDALSGTGDTYHIDSEYMEDYVSAVKDIRLDANTKPAEASTVGSEPDYIIVVWKKYEGGSHKSILMLCFNNDFTEFWASPEHGKPEVVYTVQHPEKVKRLFSWVVISAEKAYFFGDNDVSYSVFSPADANHYIEHPNNCSKKIFNALKSCKFDKSTEIKNFKGFGDLDYLISITNLCGEDISIGINSSESILTYNNRAFRIDYPDFDELAHENGFILREDFSDVPIFGRYYAAKDLIAENLVLSSIQRPEFAPVLELYNTRYDSKAQNVALARGLMLIFRDTGERRDLGEAEEITLTKENFDELFSSSAQWEEDITAQYLRENAEKVYSFSSDSEFYYIIKTNDGELYSLDGLIYREGDKVTKTLLRGYRLADVTSHPSSLGGYIDHAFYDIDNDGVEEICILSYGPTSGLYTFMFTVRQNGVDEYNTIYCPEFRYLRDPTDSEGGRTLYSNYKFEREDGRLIVTARESSLANPQVLKLDISIRDGEIVLTAEDGTEMQVWGDGSNPDEAGGLNPAPIVDIQGTATDDDQPIDDDSALELQRDMMEVPIAEVNTAADISDIESWFNTVSGKMQPVRFAIPKYWLCSGDGSEIATRNGVQMMKIVAVYRADEQPIVDELVAKLAESVSDDKLSIIDNSADSKRAYRYMLKVSEKHPRSSITSERHYYFVERDRYCFCLLFYVNQYSDTELNESLFPYFYDFIGGALEPTEFEHVYIAQYSRLNAAKNGFESVSEDDKVFITLNVPSDWNWNRGTADLDGSLMFKVGAIYPSADDEDFDILKRDSHDITEAEQGAGYSCKLRKRLEGEEVLVYLLKRDGLSAELIFNVNEHFDEEKCERLVETFDMMDMNNHLNEEG